MSYLAALPSVAVRLALLYPQGMHLMMLQLSRRISRICAYVTNLIFGNSNCYRIESHIAMEKFTVDAVFADEHCRYERVAGGSTYTHV